MVLPSLTRRRGSGPWKDCVWGGELPTVHGLPSGLSSPNGSPHCPHRPGSSPQHLNSWRRSGAQLMVGVGLPAVVPP